MEFVDNMGDTSAYEAAKKFADEFESDIIRLYGLDENYVQHVGIDDTSFEVNLYVNITFGTNSRVLIFDDVPFFFGAYSCDNNEDLINRVMDNFHLSEEVAIARLTKADVIVAERKIQ